VQVALELISAGYRLLGNHQDIYTQLRIWDLLLFEHGGRTSYTADHVTALCHYAFPAWRLHHLAMNSGISGLGGVFLLGRGLCPFVARYFFVVTAIMGALTFGLLAGTRPNDRRVRCHLWFLWWCWGGATSAPRALSEPVLGQSSG
jgi:hypothetical protein